MCVVMKKLLLLVNLSVFVLSTPFTMPKNSKGACFSSLPLELQASCLQLISTKEKVALMEYACRSLLMSCIDIRKEIRDLSLDFTSVSKAPELTIPDISNDLEIIQAHTDETAWCNNIINYPETLKLEKLKLMMLQTLDELDYTLNLARGLLEKYGSENVELRTNVSIWELARLQSIVFSIKSLQVLFPYSEVDFNHTQFVDKEDWGGLIQALPPTVRKLDLSETNIDVYGFMKLSRLIKLEEIDLSVVHLHNRENWVNVIPRLPMTIRKIDLRNTYIDIDGLSELSCLTSLEEINLWGFHLANPADWISVMQSLPVTIKRVDLSETNIDTSALCELSRLASLEEISLTGVLLSDPSKWASVLQSLPLTVRKIDLNDICIDDSSLDISALRELSRLTRLEEIKLCGVRLINREGWSSVMQSLPLTVKKMNLRDANIDLSGLLELSRFTNLEEIGLSYALLTSEDSWVSVIQSLPVTVKGIDLAETNIDTSDLCALSRLTSLEEVNLYDVKLANPGDWTSVMLSLPITVKKIDLAKSNIDASGLRELSRFIHLEEIVLNSVKLANREGWVSMMQGLPVTMRRIFLAETDIDASPLRELSRLNTLEEIVLNSVKLADPADWASVMQSLSLTLRKIYLCETNIDASGLRELSRFNGLEEIALNNVRLLAREDWVSVIQSLPLTLTNIRALYPTNCPDDLINELRAKWFYH